MSSQQKFLEDANDELNRAWAIVGDHAKNGENNVVPVDQMFPHGSCDLTFMIFTKSARMVGYEKEGDFDKVYAEIQDIANYCGFALAMIKRENPGSL